MKQALFRIRYRDFFAIVMAILTTESFAVISDGFNYPVGNKYIVTPANDGDGYYNAQDFGVNYHLGEDWNGEGGGNTDKGDPVYAVSNGIVSDAGFYGRGWGNIITIHHKLPTDECGGVVESQYAHLDSIWVSKGDRVTRGQQIGTIGNSGTKLAHLHFELRCDENIPATGPGYSLNTDGWLEPSDFIDAHRNFKLKSKRLTVNAKPVKSRIRIMNIKPKYRPGIALKPGKYDIYVTCPGYVSKRMWVEIKEADLSIEVILDKK